MPPLEVRPSRLLIIKYLYPYLSLLIIPVIRGVFTYRTHSWPRFFIAEALFALFALAVAIAKWHRFHLVVDETQLKIKKGLFYRSEFSLFANDIALIAIDKQPFLSLFSARGLRVYVETGSRRKAHIDIPVNIKAAEYILSIYRNKSSRQVYKGSFGSLFLMSAMVSTAATGLLIMAPIVNRAGKLLGTSYNTILNELNKASEYLPNIIPTTARVISIVLLLGYLVAFLNSLLRNINFKVYKVSDIMVITAGVLPNRTIILNVPDIKAISVIQNPAMQLLGRYTVKFSMAGYGLAKGESGILLPCVRKGKIEKFINNYLPQFHYEEIQHRPPSRSFGRFITPSIITALLIIPVQKLLAGILPEFAELIDFCGLISILIAFFYGITRVRQYACGGVTLDSTLNMITGQFYSLVQIRAAKNDVEYFRIIRYPFDRMVRLCRLKIALRCKNRNLLAFSALDYESLRKSLLEQYGLFHKIK
ncbi:MAG: hypothetical protein RR177_03350 [Oscillospiraceae bacterium]